MIQGKIIFREANVGSKSAGVYPYLELETGELVKIRMLNANPFEENALNEYENKMVELQGEFNDNQTFLVTDVTEITEEDNCLTTVNEVEERENEETQEECADCACKQTQEDTCTQEQCECNCSGDND